MNRKQKVGVDSPRNLGDEVDDKMDIDSLESQLPPILLPEQVGELLHHHPIYNNNNDDSSAPPPPPRYLEILFLLISFGYMLPWTALGSLISYYKYTYGASFYVKIYCCYYLPGLPVALLQHFYGRRLDRWLSSQNTFLFRGVLAFVCMFAILVSLSWFSEPLCLYMLFIALGVCGWLCHGTASGLAAIFSPMAIAYLQTGFRCPEIYAVTAVAVLDIGKDPTTDHLNTFYALSANVVLLGLVSWIAVVKSQHGLLVLQCKDEDDWHNHTKLRRVTAYGGTNEKMPYSGTSPEFGGNSSPAAASNSHGNHSRYEYSDISSPLWGGKDVNRSKNRLGSFDVESRRLNASERVHTGESETVSPSSEGSPEEPDGVDMSDSEQEKEFRVSSDSERSNSESDALTPRGDSKKRVRWNHEDSAADVEKEVGEVVEDDSEQAALLGEAAGGVGGGDRNDDIIDDSLTETQQRFMLPLSRAKRLLGNINGLLGTSRARQNPSYGSIPAGESSAKTSAPTVNSSWSETMHHKKEQVSSSSSRSRTLQPVWPLCLALLVTMWCSIFQASFFAYVDSPVGRQIEQILYFVRLFSDLLGRPLATLPRPYFMRTNFQLLAASIVRISFVVVFFLYIFVPSFPRSDVFISALVGVFSLLSGYFTVLIYEYAAASCQDKATKTRVTAILNISFQVAAFTSVVMSVSITSSDWFEKLLP